MAIAAEHRHLPEPPRLPTEHELPSEDGIPMETQRHHLQMEILIRALIPWAKAQGDVFVSGNQFIYFSAEQLRGRDFRGPDVFVVRGVLRRERKSWVVWEEGKGPDVVIELLSESTAQTDKGDKKVVYQDQLRVPQYVWMDPFNPEDRMGFILQHGRYAPLPRDHDGCLPVPVLGLRLCLWEGEYEEMQTTWLRWVDERGLLLLPEEAERQRADAEQRRANAEQQKAVAERRQAEAERQRAGIERQRAEIERQRAEAESKGRREAEQRAATMEQELVRLKALLEEKAHTPRPTVS